MRVMQAQQVPIEASAPTELILQRACMRRFLARELMLPNVYLYGSNEADFITVTKAGYVDEYEIKVSRADFRADAKKDRHEIYQVVTPWKRWNQPGHGERQPAYTAVRWTGLAKLYPNRFWYVVPEGLVGKDEIPSYAGLIYATDAGWGSWNLRDVVKAPKLHGEKIPPLKRQKLIRNGYQKFLNSWYWNAR